MKTYDKESFWLECLRNKPDLTRADYERRWARFWFWVEMMTLVPR